MIKIHMVFVTLLAAAFVGGCSSGVKSENLGRSTALTLLNKWPHIGDENVGISYPARHVIGPRDDTGYGKLAQAQVAVLNDLVKAGVATIVSSVPFDNPSISPAGSTEFRLASVPQPGVTSGNNPNLLGGTIDIHLATKSVREISGIQQQGTEAIVDAVLVTTPTPLYGKLQDATRNEIAYCKQWPGVAANLDFCGMWPDGSMVSNTQTRQFKFARYDDGWRVEGWFN